MKNFKKGDIVFADQGNMTWHAGIVAEVAYYNPKTKKYSATPNIGTVALYDIQFLDGERNKIVNQVEGIEKALRPMMGINRKVKYRHIESKPFTLEGYVTDYNIKERTATISSIDEPKKQETILLKNICFLYYSDVDEEFIILDVKLNEIHCYSFPIWKNGLSYTPTSSINVILGKNAYSKTQLLRTIAAALSNQENEIEDLKGTQGNIQISLKDIDSNKVTTKEKYEKVQLLAISDSRFLDKGKEYIEFAPYSDKVLFSEVISNLFLTKKLWFTDLENLFAFVCDLHEAAKKQASANELAEKDYSSKLLSMITTVMSTLVKANTHLEEKFTIRIKTDYHETSAKRRHQILVQLDKDSEEVAIQQVSQGTLSIISIFIVIFWYLKEIHPEAEPESLCNQAGIVLIDEIDAHLHPVWQREIITLLRYTFPKVQFILTAHSPFVVAGCFKGEVYVLDKKNGTFVLEPKNEVYVGESVTEILSEVFDVPLKDKLYMKAYEIYKEGEAKILELKKEIEDLDSKANSEEEIAELREKLRLWETIKIVRNDQQNPFTVDNLLAKVSYLNKQLRDLNKDKKNDKRGQS